MSCKLYGHFTFYCICSNEYKNNNSARVTHSVLRISSIDGPRTGYGFFYIGLHQYFLCPSGLFVKSLVSFISTITYSKHAAVDLISLSVRDKTNNIM